MKILLIVAAHALLLVCTQATGQSPQPKIPSSYHRDSLRMVLVDIGRFAGYGNDINSDLLRRAGTFTGTGDSLTLPELINALNRQTLLDFSYDDKIKWIFAVPKGVRGRIKDEYGDPVARISVKGDSCGGISNDSGYYYVPKAIFDPELHVTAINRDSMIIKIRQRKVVQTVIMQVKVSDLDKVHVLVNTGYGKIPLYTAPGAFEFMNARQIGRTTSSSVVDAMKGKISGLVMLENRLPGNNQPFAFIRGQSTIFSNTGPLIIVDNFPFAGVLDEINPNDVESITFLKDAAAASIWGSRAANGVIVITTKTGAYGKPLQVEFNTSVTFLKKPDQWYLPRLTPAEFVEIEKARYADGYYNTAIASEYGLFSPVVEVLHQYDSNKISQQEKTDRLNNLSAYDIRNDINDRLYRPGLIQRYFLGLKKGTPRFAYAASFGYDQEKAVEAVARLGLSSAR